MKQVIVNIDAEGNVTVEGHGAAGPACLDLTREIERAIGTTSKDVKTGEYYRPQTSGQHEGLRAARQS